VVPAPADEHSSAEIMIAARAEQPRSSSRALASSDLGSGLVSVLVLCVSLARFGCVTSNPPCLTAHGERTWFVWAYRHPGPEDLFRRIGRQLRPGEPIDVVASLGQYESYWWHGMASYFLWEHQLAAANRRGAPPAPRPGRALVIVSDAGEIRVLEEPHPP
jgi:hypothetical protein